jgi:cytochrome c biogenesis protein CcdA
MVGLTLLVVSIALADSINPSTVIPALWLASAPRASRLLSYTLGVFAVYLAGGLVLVFGPGAVLIAAFHSVQGPVEHALQATGGVLALGFALALWRSRRTVADEPRIRRSYTRLSAFTLGAGIMAIELPTAFMYFGAISAILAAHKAAPAEISLLIVYNALFVAPIVALLALRRLAGAQADQWIAAAEARVSRLGQLALTGAAAAGGAALLAIGLVGLVAT